MHPPRLNMICLPAFNLAFGDFWGLIVHDIILTTGLIVYFLLAYQVVFVF